MTTWIGTGIKETDVNHLMKLAALFVLGIVGIGGTMRASAADMNTAADEIQIQSLFAHYVYALDLHDPKAYAALFTPDGVVTMGERKLNGRTEIEGLIQGYRDKIDFSKIKADKRGRKFGTVRHVNTGFVIDVTGDTATAESYWMEIKSNADMNGIGDRPSVLDMGRYEDTLVKRDGRWFFKTRDIIADMYDPSQPSR